MHRISDARRGFWLASLTFLPLFVWWLGWFPGFFSSDSIDQLGQVESGEYTNGHTAFHTLTLWLITRFWHHPGAISLVQIVVLALLLGLVARRIVELGTPLWPAVGAAWLVGLAPAVGPTAITIWKDVAFTLGFLWVFAELLMVARLRSTYWFNASNAIRLGAALSLVWLYRHNGLLTALVVVAVLAWVFRTQLSRVALTMTTLLAIVLIVQGPLFWIFSVGRGKPAAAEVLLPVVASSFVHEPGNFSREELELLSSIAPLEVWRDRYDCDHADPLLFDPDLNIDVIRRNPGPFFRLGIRTIFRDLDTSLGMFWCRGSYLFVPMQPDDAFLHRPPFAIPTNDLGLERSPVWAAAYDLTFDVFQVAESGAWLWLTWRPALVIWLTLATYAGVARRGPRILLVPGTLLGIHLINVATTSLNHEFRLAFPVYVAGILSLPLLWFVRYPERLSQPERGIVMSRRSLLDDDIAAVRTGESHAERIE